MGKNKNNYVNERAPKASHNNQLPEIPETREKQPQNKHKVPTAPNTPRVHKNRVLVSDAIRSETTEYSSVIARSNVDTLIKKGTFFERATVKTQITTENTPWQAKNP